MPTRTPFPTSALVHARAYSGARGGPLWCALAVLLLAVGSPPGVALAQTTAMVGGVVRDVQGGVLPGATVMLSRPLTGFERTTSTDASGTFRLANIPFDTYALVIEFPGFVTATRVVEARSTVPVTFDVTLELGGQSTSVVVSPGPPLLDTTSAGTRHTLSVARIETLPVASGSRGLEAVLVSFPGFSQNANGAIHPRGAHNQMTYVVDGLPISDQLTGAFANALDVGVVETLELITGNVPAEFGSKVSGVAVVTSRSGAGTGRRLAGSTSVSASGFGTVQGTVQGGGERGRAGYFVSATGLRTGRFLDQVSLDNLHNDGAFGRAFVRTDVRLGGNAILRVNAMGGRSAFDVANLRSQQTAGQDQRQRLGDGAAWVSYLHPLGATATVESTAGYRTATADLRDSPGDTPVTASQDRRLSTLTATVRYSRIVGRHRLRTGADVQRTPIREHFSMGITAPGFNDPLDPHYNAALAPHDLSRGGRPFTFAGAATGLVLAGFAEATLRWSQATVTLGLRHDTYDLLVRERQLQPRVGVSQTLPDTWGVVRASYNRNLQTPPNENLLLSSSASAAALAPQTVREALGGAYRPLRPERQQVVEVGYQRAFGDRATLDVSAYRKWSVDQQDNNNFFDTGIIFPTTLAALHVTGVEGRVSFREVRRVSGSLSVSGGRAIATPPFTGGLFLGQDAVDLLSSGPFPIDHDQRLSVHGTAHYDPVGPAWLSVSVRYDSGLVANPSDPATVAADPDYADLLPYVDLLAETSRVRPRTIVDAAAGIDVGTSGRRTWSAQVQVTNVTNRTALYNFQSVFVGTRLVQPRTFAVRLTRHF